ncbi:LPXTG cell wall anchor domain-containing protein [Microbacterium laevaniformans]
MPATGGSSALVLGVSGFGIAGVIVGIVLLTRRRRREV